MPVLHLGEVEIPYGDSHAPAKPVAQAKKGKAAKPLKVSVGVDSKTTGDVGEILDRKYHIYTTFWSRYQNRIAKNLEESLGDAIEVMMNGGPAARDPLTAATSSIETMFKAFLSNREMDGLPGIPTQAAQDGVSHRFKHPYAKRAPRPSFIDTGLLQTSFRAWVDK